MTRIKALPSAYPIKIRYFRYRKIRFFDETPRTPRLSRNKAPDTRSPASREIVGGEAAPGEARDFEMRDVRRDGLIEALLIAFTPPRGLPYPRMGVSAVHPPSPADPHGGRIPRNPPYLPSFAVLLPPRAIFSFLIADFASPLTVPFVCTRCSAARAISYGLAALSTLSVSPSRFLLEASKRDRSSFFTGANRCAII